MKKRKYLIHQPSTLHLTKALLQVILAHEDKLNILEGTYYYFKGILLVTLNPFFPRNSPIHHKYFILKYIQLFQKEFSTFFIDIDKLLNFIMLATLHFSRLKLLRRAIDTFRHFSNKRIIAIRETRS